eukprot:CCRYP_003598-RA/>CCRYP_003598-RA protein AED:0.06 eAED:0.06 QI:0/-1/0/1/-1/1/1/0/516
MKAPKRLLMIYLLRTTAAAFANSRTAPSKTSRSAKPVLLRAYTSSSSSGSSVANNDHPSSSSSSKPFLTSGHITFRLARSADVPQIQACNLATLPENYNDNFYMNHMRQWPELALVAEHVPDGCTDPTREGEHDDGDGAAISKGGITPLRDYLGRVRKGASSSSSSSPPHSAPKREIVGYILGKVEERPILHPPVRRTNLPPSTVAPLYEGPYHGGNTPPSWSKPTTSPPWEKLGHVTSLAVHSHARRLGIASSLLRQLHYHLHECYSAHAVGLHVRLSNAAAVKLYVETLGYDVADIIPMYYGDGEDAYFMRKELGERRREDVVVVGRRGEASRRGGGGDGRESSLMHSSSRRGTAVPEWVNRDTRSSFFENRTSMRDMLSSEERAWIDSNRGGGRIAGSGNNESQSSFTGKVTRSFRTFLHGNEEPRRFVNHKNFRSLENWQSRPPWETGPEELRLPRYVQIVRPADTTRNVENRDSSRKNGIIHRGQKEEEEEQDVGAEEYSDARSVAASGTG